MPPLSDVAEAFKISNRERIPPPKKAFDFLPDLMAETEEVLGPAGSEAKEKKPFKYRDDIKPLHVLQPEGVSFKMNGHELEWQNWKMHIGKFINSKDWQKLLTMFRSLRSTRRNHTIYSHV